MPHVICLSLLARVFTPVSVGVRTWNSKTCMMKGLLTDLSIFSSFISFILRGPKSSQQAGTSMQKGPGPFSHLRTGELIILIQSQFSFCSGVCERLACFLGVSVTHNHWHRSKLIEGCDCPGHLCHGFSLIQRPHCAGASDKGWDWTIWRSLAKRTRSERIPLH